jgi:hypothetical protein
MSVIVKEKTLWQGSLQELRNIRYSVTRPKWALLEYKSDFLPLELTCLWVSCSAASVSDGITDACVSASLASRSLA